MAIPDFVSAFSIEEINTAAKLDKKFLHGQGGSVWASTAQRLYDPNRLETELRTGPAKILDQEIVKIA